MKDLTYSADPGELLIDETRQIARQIADAVQDSEMHPSIPMKVARAVTERRISTDELKELLDYICTRRVAGADGKSDPLKSPGAYFVTCIKRVFQKNGARW